MSQAKAPAGGILRTSLDNTWQTPPRILDRVRVYFDGPIPFDPATADGNPTGALKYCAGPPGTLFAQDDLATHNGLEVEWRWPWFCNPPYGRELKLWLAKMTRESYLREENAGIALLPCARWEQAYFTATLAAAGDLCLVRGRVDFISSRDGQPVKGNPYASMLLGFNVDPDRFFEAFGPLGRCFKIESLPT